MIPYTFCIIRPMSTATWVTVPDTLSFALRLGRKYLRRDVGSRG